jgi:hypothetical protein
LHWQTWIWPKFQHAYALKIWFNTQIPLMNYWQTWYH